MQQRVFFFLRLLIIGLVSNVHESPHGEVNGGVFILYVLAYFWIKCILLNTMDIIAYFDYKSAKNACFF